jgi:mercuric ion transport protein
MKKENISSIGTVLTSLLAASCCIGPAVFVIFGASAGFLSKLSFLEPARPYLLGAAFLLLSYSYWKLYLKKEAIACACDADVRTRKIARGIFWVGFGALLIAVSFQRVVVWFFG